MTIPELLFCATLEQCNARPWHRLSITRKRICFAVTHQNRHGHTSLRSLKASEQLSLAHSPLKIGHQNGHISAYVLLSYVHSATTPSQLVRITTCVQLQMLNAESFADSEAQQAHSTALTPASRCQCQSVCVCVWWQMEDHVELSQWEPHACHHHHELAPHSWASNLPMKYTKRTDACSSSQSKTTQPDIQPATEYTERHGRMSIHSIKDCSIKTYTAGHPSCDWIPKTSRTLL